MCKRKCILAEIFNLNGKNTWAVFVFHEQKFKHSFQDTLNLISNCDKVIENSSYYLFHCPDYLQERMTRLNTARCIDANILDLNSAQLTAIAMYGKKN